MPKEDDGKVTPMCFCKMSKKAFYKCFNFTSIIVNLCLTALCVLYFFYSRDILMLIPILLCAVIIILGLVSYCIFRVTSSMSNMFSLINSYMIFGISSVVSLLLTVYYSYVAIRSFFDQPYSAAFFRQKLREKYLAVLMIYVVTPLSVYFTYLSYLNWDIVINASWI